MNTYYLVRHAHANWSPDEDRPLSPQGQEAARRVADILAQRPIKRIYASPYKRAYQTVEPLAERLNIPINYAADLRERLLSEVEIDDFSEAVAATWRDPHFACPGGESNYVAQQRGVAFIEQIHHQHQGQHIVLATHGNLLALILQHFDASIGYAFWQSLTMPEIYAFKMTDNDSLHLERLWEESPP